MSNKKSKKIKSKDLENLIDRRKFLKDESRPDAVKKRHDHGQRTARENVADLCDINSFLEYGSLIVAAQRSRRSEQELIERTPADGLIAGIGSINGHLFGLDDVKCIILCYDYTVLAGTQGIFNHKKTDRLIEIAGRTQKPIIFFAEGGGGRPGDVDMENLSNGGLDLNTFVEYARLSGKVPRIAIVSGYCFAGNASIAGCSDVVIATKNTSIGMGGPAMIEAGGLGAFHPKEIGPSSVQSRNGVIDILVSDEAEAVSVAKKYLSYFQGVLPNWTCEDQKGLRHVIPEDRRFAFDIFKVIKGLADHDSILELRKDFAENLITSFIRIEGRPMGLMANSTKYLGGAIDSDAADKAARFMQLCNAFGIPILSLCDVPGFMVGPDSEKKGLVRHSSRMFVVGSTLSVPIFTVVLRRAYGLGAMAMAGGSLNESQFTISWPSGEFGPMGLEGAVKLGFKRELDAARDEQSRNELYDQLVEKSYQRGKAINTASFFEFDEVIDPKDTRKWLINGMNMTVDLPKIGSREFIDCW